jgi:hypothetical protein
MHSQILPAAELTDHIRRFPAICVLSVSVGLVHIGSDQFIQYLLMAAFAVIIIKVNHVYPPVI